jgi:hypothetical protein
VQAVAFSLCINIEKAALRESALKEVKMKFMDSLGAKWL